MTNPLRRMESTMSKANKPLVIVGSAALAAAMTTLVSTAEAGKHHGGGFRFHHHRHVYIAPVYTETYRVVRKPVVQPQQKVAVIRYADGMGRVYDVASKVWHDGQNHCWSGKLGVDVQERRLVLRQLPLVRGGRHLAHQCAGGAEVRRLRDHCRVRRQGRAHRRARQRADRKETLAGTAESGSPEEPAQLRPPGRRQCGQGQRMQEVFPERRRNAACALHERPFVAIIGPPKSAHHDRPATTRAWRT